MTKINTSLYQRQYDAAVQPGVFFTLHIKINQSNQCASMILFIKLTALSLDKTQYACSDRDRVGVSGRRVVSMPGLFQLLQSDRLLKVLNDPRFGYGLTFLHVC